MRQGRRATVLSTASATVALLLSKPLLDPHPIIIWNASKSIPIGLYRVEKGVPATGELAVLKLPSWAGSMADNRRYLPHGAWLLKPVAAGASNVVCRFGQHIFINGRIVACALRRDKSGRALPVWKGCASLRLGHIFVLSRYRDSFDSRYFGPVSSDLVLGTAKPIIILGK
jgi:conjugative transfer signal peptidase TraF